MGAEVRKETCLHLQTEGHLDSALRQKRLTCTGCRQHVYFLGLWYKESIELLLNMRIGSKIYSPG